MNNTLCPVKPTYDLFLVHAKALNNKLINNLIKVFKSTLDKY